jgi:hypothetical protein
MIARKARTVAVALVCWLAAGCPNSAGVTCPLGQQACNGVCVTLAVDAKNCGGCGKTCPAALACIDGACGCPAGLVDCNDRCVDPNVDGQNCGGCGKPCGPGTACSAGSCMVTCGTGLMACNNQCVDTQTNQQNCGQCGMPCGDRTICCGGACITPDSTDHCGSCAPCPMATPRCFDDGGFMCGPPG